MPPLSCPLTSEGAPPPTVPNSKVHALSLCPRCEDGWETLSLSWDLLLSKEPRSKALGRQPGLSTAVKNGIIMECFHLHLRPDLTRKCQVPWTLQPSERRVHLSHATMLTELLLSMRLQDAIENKTDSQSHGACWEPKGAGNGADGGR